MRPHDIMLTVRRESVRRVVRSAKVLRFKTWEGVSEEIIFLAMFVKFIALYVKGKTIDNT